MDQAAIQIAVAISALAGVTVGVILATLFRG